MRCEGYLAKRSGQRFQWIGLPDEGVGCRPVEGEVTRLSDFAVGDTKREHLRNTVRISYPRPASPMAQEGIEDATLPCLRLQTTGIVTPSIQ